MKLLFDSKLTETLTENDIKERWRGGGDLTQDQLAAALKIIKALWPYAPDKNNWRNSGYSLPFVILANIILQTAGYDAFTREFCPVISLASIQTLHLDAAGIYELFGSGKAAFDIKDADGDTITSSAEARTNAERMFAAFFNLDRFGDAAKTLAWCLTIGSP